MTDAAAKHGLPDAFAATLDDLSLRPLWLAPVHSVSRAPGRPFRRAEVAHWPYKVMRDLLVETGAMISVEDAERRVFMLINPGYKEATAVATAATIFIGLQLILPGERAPNHRHTATAARFIVEGNGAYTAVNGEKLPMAPGDLVLTPTDCWHEHGHKGEGPMLWLDILDLPLCVPLDGMTFEPGQLSSHLADVPDASETAYSCPGLVPYRAPNEQRPRYPMMIYRWAKVREALQATAAVWDAHRPLHFMYVNPETGQSALAAYNFSARMLRPGEEIVVQPVSACAVVHVIDGAGESEIDDRTIAWEKGDVISIPTYARVRHRNRSTRSPAFLMQVDDSPFQHSVGRFKQVVN